MNQETQAALVYLVFATPGAGGEVLAVDLLDGLDELADDGPLPVVLAEGAAHAELMALEAERGGFQVVEYQLGEDGFEFDRGAVEEGAPMIFLAPGLAQPPDVIEALRGFLKEGNGRSLGRILTVVDCAHLSATPGMRPWVLCCIHFSDAVLLNRREGVANQWIREFEKFFQKECYPCRFFLVKKDRVTNPSEVMQPEARRLSLVFDDFPGVNEVADFMDEEDSEAIEEDEMRQAEDSYLVRLESGARARPVPGIAKWFSEDR